MKKKNRIQKLVVLASALATMGFGSSLYAATYSVNPSATSKVWENPATWFIDADGDGTVDAGEAATVAPGANDVVKLNGQTVTINGTSSNYAVKSLDLSTANSILQPAAGENITLKVGGDITFGDAASKIQQNGTGKLNLNIISSATLTLADDANMTVNNLTITDASVTSAAAKTITVNGNLDVKGTSSLKIAEGTPGVAGIVFPEGNHTVTVDPTASLSVATLTNGIGTSTSTGSTLVTSSNMTIYKSLTNKNDATFTANDGTITINGALTNAGTFTANGGTVRFNNADAACWANTGTMTLNNVEFLGTTAYAPATTALVKGNFSKLGTGSVKPTTAADIQFTGATQKTILNAGAPGDLEFAGGIVVASGASVATSSSFNIKSLETKANASFKANNGDITFNADGAITAVTPNSIEFNNLSIGAVVTTSSDFKILGNLTTVATGDKLTASAPSTITFENVAERTITSAADDDITFANMKVAAGSKVKNAAATSSFTVKDGGIEVEGTGSLVVDPAATVTFDGTTNTIKNEGTLSFGLVNVKAGSVTTASDFTVTGTTGGTNEAFTNAGTFEATDGTVTFTGAAPAIVADADQTKTVFNGITADGGANTTVLTVTTGDAISINGDLTVNGTSTFAGADETAIVHFTGTKDQTIGGTSTATPAVSFPTTTVDKASGKLLLEKDVTLVASGALNLKNGIVDMGTTTLTANVAPTKVAGTDFGAIDGDKGTYVVATAHTLNDNLFTVDGEPTLNNLTAVGVLTLDGDLTVNGNLDLQIAKNAIAGNTLTVKGNLTHTVATGTFDAATGKLVLTGTGATTGLSNAYFEGTDGCDVNLEIGRAETLGGDLTMATGKTLTINTGINYLDLGEKTLTTSNNAALGIERISGSIDATKATLVKFTDAAAFTLPGNLFKDNTVSNLTIAGEMTLGSDLTVTGTLTNGSKNIITGEKNIMTFGPQMTFGTALANNACIVGNLKRTVTNTATKFDIGGGTGATDYNPVTLNFQTSGTTQEVIVSAKATEPTVGRAGNPDKALDLVYTIKPIGTDPNDALNATFETGTATTTTGFAKGNIPAKWENGAWVDYRANLGDAATANNAIVTNYAIANSTALAGDWALFNIGEAYTAGTNDDKVDAAITTAAKNVVITSISPNPVQANIPFNVTVQLQDQYGQLITTNTRVNVNLTQKLGEGAIGNATGEIAAGSSFTTLTAIATAVSANNQLQIDDDNAPDVYAASVGEAFNVIADAPTEQATITAITPANTTAKITWAGTATNALIVLKAGEALTEDEFPVNGTTYTADALYGAGSQIGDAVVVAKGASGTDVTIRSLSPNTTYYAYAFAFAGTTDGTENYILTAASGNPQPFTTLGSNDDDVAFGENNTRETSRAIGTNTPVKGTIKDATDVDWFNFSVSSANPNVRAQLSTLPANYNVEIYNSEGKRIRRGIRVGQGSEGPVINGLAAGTYTLKIYSQDGSSSAEPYTLKVGTKSSEIFSVTP